jgi:hypothetical protein
MVAGNRHSGSVEVAPFRSALREYGRIKVCCKNCKAKVYEMFLSKTFNNPVQEGLHPCWELYLGMNTCGILQVSKMDEPLKGGRQVVANGMPSKVQCATNN